MSQLENQFGEAQRGALSKARRAARKLGVPEIRRHVLMCMDRDTAKCASRREMAESWDYLKRRLKELGREHYGRVLRTKTECLDVCAGGPLVIVYPEGTWYGHCVPAVLERILTEHVLAGRVVEEFVVARPSLCPLVKETVFAAVKAEFAVIESVAAPSPRGMADGPPLDHQPT